MGDINPVFESLVAELRKMINNICDLGIDTKEYKEKLNNIINEVYSKVEESKIKWGNNANMFFETDYYAAIKKINQLKLELSEYNIYFKAVNTCKYLILELDDIDNLKDEGKINNYVETIIELLRNIKKNNTIYNIRTKTILKEIYDTVYQIIKLEIIKFGKSRVYEYVKDYDTDIFFLEKCVRKEIENLNLDDKKYENIQKRVYEINSYGLITNYFDIDLIKLLIAYSDNIDLKEEVVNKLKYLRKEINNNVSKLEKDMVNFKSLKTNLKKVKYKLNKARMSILSNLFSFVIVIPVMLYYSVKSSGEIKKQFVNEVYPRIVTTYSKEYGLKQEKDYVSSYSIDDNKTSILDYGNWMNIGNDYSRLVFKYDITNIKLENISDYLDLDIGYILGSKDVNDLDVYTEYLKNPEDLQEKEHLEVEQITVGEEKVQQIEDEKLYKEALVKNYISYGTYFLIIEFFIYLIENKRIHSNFMEYKKLKNKYLKKLSEIVEYRENLLRMISNDERLRTRFWRLYNENKYLLDDPDKFVSKIRKLSDTKIRVIKLKR